MNMSKTEYVEQGYNKLSDNDLKKQKELSLPTKEYFK